MLATSLEYHAMRSLSLGITVIVYSMLSALALEEPKTGAVFGDSFDCEGKLLCCTGAGYRNFLLFRVFTVAHYGDPEEMPAEDTTPEKRLQHWRESRAPRALVLRMMRNVGADRFVSGQRDAMDRAGYDGKNRKAYIATFDRSAKKGEEIHVLAPGDGWLVMVWAGEEVGRWQDQALVDAVWSVWLHPISECSNPEALVTSTEDCTQKETA
jgi:hypothetical protein